MINKTRINLGKVGIVRRKGDYKTVLTSGTHYLGVQDVVVTYGQSVVYPAPADYDVLEDDECFDSRFKTVDVNEQELLLVLRDEKFVELLSTGKYIYFDPKGSLSFQSLDMSTAEVEADLSKQMRTSNHLSSVIVKYKVLPYQKAVLLIDGIAKEILNEGVYYYKNATEQVELLYVDMRQRQMDLLGQEILSKDKAAVRVNYTLQYQVVDVLKAVHENVNYEKQAYVIVQVALRELMGRYTLDELLEKKDSFPAEVQKATADGLSKLGMVVNSSGVKDIILPGDVKEIMNQVLVAQKQAQANTIMRREETASTRSLLNTAKLIEENPTLSRLKEMEYVERVAEKIGEISLSGSGDLMTQLGQIFTPKSG